MMIDGALENTKPPKWKMFLYYATFICLMLAGFLMVFSLRNRSEPDSGPFDKITPQILVGDTVYYWAEMSYEKVNEGLPGKQVSTTGEHTYLPDGYTEYGAFLATVATPPDEELQMQADFSGFGIVYRNPDTPEVLYIKMTTDWFSDEYVRFASRDIFDGDRVALNGKQYCTQFRKGISSPLEVLPEDAVLIGALHYIGQDRIPQNDLETNCITDDHGMSLEGREVFADPNDPCCIYVYSSHLNSGGGYYQCPVWESSYLLQHVK